MKLTYPIISEIAFHTYLVNEYGMATFYVIWGSKRGLVIDAGCGSFDARGLVEKLLPVPYDVVLTHAHGDHAGAMSQWDQIWLHPDDLPRIHNTKRLKEMLWENPAIRFNPDGIGAKRTSPAGIAWDMPYFHYNSQDIYEVSEDMFMGFEKMPEFLPLEEGQTFDLGDGHVIEVIHTPGHSEGSVCLLDYKSRILFSGDACNVQMGISASSVNSTLRGLLKLKAKQPFFDQNFSGHSGYGGNLCTFSMPDSTLDDCIWICRAILNGTAVIDSYRKLSYATHAVVKHGEVAIHYDTARVIDPGEEPAE